MKEKTNLSIQRKSAGMTAEQLAQESGVSISAIKKYESGEKDINNAKLPTLVAICKALNCRLSAVVSDENLIADLLSINE